MHLGKGTILIFGASNQGAGIEMYAIIVMQRLKERGNLQSANMQESPVHCLDYMHRFAGDVETHRGGGGKSSLGHEKGPKAW